MNGEGNNYICIVFHKSEPDVIEVFSSFEKGVNYLKTIDEVTWEPECGGIKCKCSRCMKFFHDCEDEDSEDLEDSEDPHICPECKEGIDNETWYIEHCKKMNDKIMKMSSEVFLEYLQDIDDGYVIKLIDVNNLCIVY